MRQVLTTVLMTMIRLYWRVSPFLGSRCRFHPTCSRYMAAAIAAHGPYRGLWFGLRRLLRCHPLHPGGFDPVPAGPDPAAARKHEHA